MLASTMRIRWSSISGIRSGFFLQITAIYVAKHCIHSSMFVTVLCRGLLGLAWSSLNVLFASPSLSGDSSAVSINSPVFILVTNLAGMGVSLLPYGLLPLFLRVLWVEWVDQSQCFVVGFENVGNSLFLGRLATSEAKGVCRWL